MQELTHSEDWEHCDGKIPADFLSRTCSVKELIEAKIWKEQPG